MNNSSENKSLSNFNSSVDATKKVSLWRSILAFAGPAYLVSVGYMDPGNWATDLAAGSGFGYKLLWVLLMSNLIAILLQTLSARLGIVRGRDLAQVSRERYPAFVNSVLYIFAEIAIAACDLAEVLGMAIGLNLLFGLPLIWGVLITMVDSVLLLFLLDIGIRKLEVFIISLIVIIGFSFFIEIFISKPVPVDVLSGFIPVIQNKEALYITIGIIGATVMPHNLYLHSALAQSRKIGRDEKGIRRALWFNGLDSFVALNMAFVVNCMILILAAAVFFTRGMLGIADINQAQKLLEPLMGSRIAPIVFAVALIASGQSSTITGTLAGQVVMEGYLDLRIAPWLRRLITRLLAVVPAVITISLYGEKSVGDLLILSQVILSIQLGFAVIPLIHVVSEKEKMGKFAIGTITKILAWLCAVIIIGLNGKLVYDELISVFQTNTGIWPWVFLAASLAAVALLIYITLHPFFAKKAIAEVPAMHKPVVNLNLQTMPVFKHIAITIDFSIHDEKSINRAISLGGKDASYHLIHIVESAGAIVFGREIADYESKDDLLKLETYANQLKERGFHTTIELGFGTPSQLIPQLVKKSNADLLVMGTHGHRALKDFIFGATINTVRHRIDIPLLSVK